jgi:hypothetical protein
MTSGFELEDTRGKFLFCGDAAGKSIKSSLSIPDYDLVPAQNTSFLIRIRTEQCIAIMQCFMQSIFHRCSRDGLSCESCGTYLATA